MDPVTKHVVRLLADTMTAPEAGKGPGFHVNGEQMLTEHKDHPIGDVRGQVKVPGSGATSGFKPPKDQVVGQEGKGATANGMTDNEMLRGLPNGSGRLAQMLKQQKGE